MLKCANCSQVGRHPFCSLGAESRTFLEASSVEMEYPRGSTLFREGDHAHAVYIVCSGSVKVYATSREGRTMILRLAEAGDVLGMSAALADGDCEVTAEALQPARIRVLHVKQLKHMLLTFDDVSVQTAKILAADYRTALDEARMMGLSGTAKGRIARLILRWSGGKAKCEASNSFITMPLTHDELASMTGTTRETVTRALGQLRKDQIISIQGIALTVLDHTALEQCCGS